MASWLLPAIKLVAGNLDTIVDAARPLFTKRKNVGSGDQASLVQQQIAELQAAVSENSAQIHELAEQLKTTVTAIQQGVALAEQRETKNRRLMIGALAISFAAIALALIALVTAYRA